MSETLQRIGGQTDQLYSKIDLMYRIDKFNGNFKTNFNRIGVLLGMNSEEYFHDELKKLLANYPTIEVINFSAFDQEGMVFKRPDQAEIDGIIKNGMVILLELKSYISRTEMSKFERKVADNVKVI